MIQVTMKMRKPINKNKNKELANKRRLKMNLERNQSI